MSSPCKRFTTMPFTRYKYVFPDLSLHFAFSSLSRTLKLGLQSKLLVSRLSKRLYNLFFPKNLIQSFRSWAQNVVVLRSVQVKSCSVMVIKLMVRLCTGMFRLFQVSLFSINLFLRNHLSLYYQFLVHFRFAGNRAQRVKYLHVDIDCRATVRDNERYYKIRKYRDREPSRINEKKILMSMKKRTNRKRIKLVLRNFNPPSSRLRSIAAHYKMWYVIHHCRSDSFFSSFFCRGLKKHNMQSLRTSDNKLVNDKKNQNTSSDHICYQTCGMLNSDFIFSPNKRKNNCFCTENNLHVNLNSRHVRQCKYFCVARRKLLLSGDIELNPGPSDYIVLTQRLSELGLRPPDVGGDGDCFFRAVSHQLFGTPKSHLAIRLAGIQYLRNLPEQFIESNVANSWSEYLNMMSRQGTWCDGIIVQAVANSLNIKIHITESHNNFTERTIIEPAVCPQEESRTIYLGQVNEIHYVSTVPDVSVIFRTTIANTCNSRTHMANNNIGKSTSASDNKNSYMRTYMAKRRANEDSECRQERLTKQHRYAEQQRAAKKKCTEEQPTQSKNATQRTAPDNNRKEERLNENQQYQKSVENLISKFHSIVSSGPVYICSCCDQLWYKHSVTLADNLRLSNATAARYLLSKRSVENKEWLCNTCMKYLKKNKVPPLAAVNGMQFPVKLECFDLNELEWRLLAPRLAFQKLMQAPRGKQLKITGNVVNVPADVSSTVNLLPRLTNETGTIKVKLKRRLQYKSSALSLNVRPHKVIQAASWLTENSDLYKEEGIVVNSDWQSSFIDNPSGTDRVEPENQSLKDDITTENCENNANENELSCNENNDNNKWIEDEDEIPAGVTDTMLTAPDFLDDIERENILNVAPAEGSTPLSVFRDKHSEELAYPGIFLGKKRTENDKRLVPVHYSDVCKSELRCSDRRAAISVENIFFNAKKFQMKILLGKSQIAMRKCRGVSRTLTAGHLKQEGALERLVHLDEGFKFLRALRGSPPYFECAKKDLFAMIRQLGPATLFCSFSAAETQWIHLLRILGKLVDGKEYSDNELENLNWEQKCRLIQSDPVTCARHFDYQFNQFLNNFLMSNIAP